MSRNATSGSCRVGERERLVAVARLGDDLELGPRLGEARLQLRAQQRLVLGDQRGGHRHLVALALRARHSIGTSSSVSRASGIQRRATHRRARGVKRPAVPYSAASRSRTLVESDAVARRAPAARGRGRCRRPSTTSALAVARARDRRRVPPAAAGSMPCLIAFSTSEISRFGGNGCAASVVGHVDGEREPRAHPHLQDLEVGLGERRPPGPASSTARAAAAARRAGSRAGGRAGACACGGSVSVRYWTDASVLNRKCGSTCACISFSSASIACFDSRCRSASALCSAAAARVSRYLT